ncbi:hypothetical protein B0H19DRAFT_930117 [Mycena capillaripes]|nr:hypothetical protein B0H19DRAFT_930117 [Mycena capillaripes]
MAETQFCVTESTITCNNDAPFDDETADVICRSLPDNIDFRVHKSFLSVASPFFKDMFSLPQSEDTDLQVVPFQEDKETLGTLLRMCYPHWTLLDCQPLFSTIERVLAVFTAARKYAMDGVEREVRAVLVDPHFVEPEPLRVFALAVKHLLYDEAKVCARYTLRLPVLGMDYTSELQHITAEAYYRLQEYHVRCGVVAQGVGQDVRWITSETWVWFECSLCRGNTAMVMAGQRRKWVTKWWADFITEASTALRERPSASTVGIDSDVVHTAMEKASACTTCRSRLFREMRRFCSLFAAEVDKAIGTVSLHFSEKLLCLVSIRG